MKDYNNLISERVHHYYWDEDLNCATTVLLIMAEIFAIELLPQTLHAAIGMHGAGGFRAQCGLVEGSLMFIGIIGRERGLADESIIKYCYDFAAEFQKNFGSLSCSELRPQGFKPDNPPHLCENLTRKVVQLLVENIHKININSD